MSISSTSVTLLRRVLDGEETAWSELVHLYGGLVYAWCRSKGIRENDSADILQQVFQVVSQEMTTFRFEDPKTSFRGWLFGIARHKIADHFRQQQRRHERPLDVHDETAEFVGVAADLEDSDARRRQDQAFLIRRACEEIRQFVGDDAYVIIWELCVNRRTAPEVADQLGISADAVRTRKSRILFRLREQFTGLEDFFDHDS
ncbi:MAG: sigma-70 family RNA polymerase sigma factor [Planctomycetota bacterium]